jgi:hypothetical protein
MTGNIWSGWVDFDVYVDGKFTTTITKSENASTKTMAEVFWNNTESHTVKLVAISFGILFWDTLVFTPQ